MFNVNIDDSTFAAMHIIEIIAILVVIGIIVVLFRILPKMIESRIEKQKALNCEKEKERDLILDGIKNTMNSIIDEFKSDRDERHNRQHDVDNKFTSLEKMINDVAHMAKDTAITAGLDTINNDNLLITDVIHEALKLYSIGGNGSSIDRLITVVMKDKEYKKIWKSETARFIRERGVQSDHFNKCIDEITKRTGW